MRGGESRVAFGRVISACGVHRDESTETSEERCEVLQRPGHSRVMDQGRQERGEVDEVVLL